MTNETPVRQATKFSSRKVRVICYSYFLDYSEFYKKKLLIKNKNKTYYI